MDNVFYFFGGASLFYLGTYGYGADVTTPDERAFRQNPHNWATVCGEENANASIHTGSGFTTAARCSPTSSAPP